MYYLLSSLSFVIGVVLLPVKYMYNGHRFPMLILQHIQLFWQPIIIPIYLIVLHIYFTKFTKQRKIKWYVSMLVALLIVLLNVLIDYICWGITTGLLTNPDGLTLMLVEFMIYFPLIIIYLTIGIFELIWYIAKRRKNKRR